jgi:hypothetical protein
VHHHVYDRAILTSVARKQKALHVARQFNEDAILPEGDARLRWLLSLFTSAGCVVHDSHNALKWAVFQRSTELDTVRHLFVCVESIRQGFDELVVHLPGWIVSLLHYEDVVAASSWPESWKLCCVPHAIHDLLAELELRWENGALKVATKCRDHEDLPQTLLVVFMGVWSWRRLGFSVGELGDIVQVVVGCDTFRT